MLKQSKRISSDIEDEQQHFMKCNSCGQFLDMRDLAEVIHHEEPCHKPILSH